MFIQNLKAKALLIAGCFFILTGCGFNDYKAKTAALETAAIKAVQQAKSTHPGTNTTDAIAGLLQVLENRGRYVKLVGWRAAFAKDDNCDVWFTVKVNDDESQFHWVIEKGTFLIPANTLAQNVTVRQQVNLQ